MTLSPATLLLIALGGALGALARYFTQQTVALYTGLTFPWGTLLANVLGCLLIGLLSGYWMSHDYHLSEEIKALVVIGFLGAFTTFSAFSLDTLVLYQNGEILKAIANVFLNITVCLIAVAVGHWLMRQQLNIS
jgi:CrcB protein